MLGRTPGPLLGHPFAAIVHLQDQSRWATCLRRAGDAGLATTASARLSHVNGSWVDVEMRVVDLIHEPDVRGIVVVIRDASERRAEEEELRQLTLQDPLTRLANRALFREHVERALAHQRLTPVCHAVLFLDLDRFKNVNDSWVTRWLHRGWTRRCKRPESSNVWRAAAGSALVSSCQAQVVEADGAPPLGSAGGADAEELQVVVVPGAGQAQEGGVWRVGVRVIGQRPTAGP